MACCVWKSGSRRDGRYLRVHPKVSTNIGQRRWKSFKEQRVLVDLSLYLGM